MVRLNRKIECCGAGFENENISLLGVVTFSFPLVLIGFVFLPFYLLLQFIFPGFSKWTQAVRIIFQANLKLIEKAELAPRWKCELSSRLIPQFPRAAGLVFRYFNLGILVVTLFGLAAIFYGGHRWR